MCAVLLMIILTAGCTSFVSNMQTPQKTLTVRDTAVFTQEKVKFTATIDSVSLIQNTNPPYKVSASMTVKNTGKDAFSLIGYPRLVDGAGKEYPGSAMQFGSVLPGGMSAKTCTIPVQSQDEYNALAANALLKVKFQSMTPLPYEGIWQVDL